MANVLAKDDGAVQKALNALSSHTSTMDAAYQTVSNLLSEIKANYLAQSSTTYQQAVEDWLLRCNAVRDMFKTLTDDLHGANIAISAADERALGISHSFASQSSNPTYSVLMGQ
jgi:uncharacterized protein YukE